MAGHNGRAGTRRTTIPGVRETGGARTAPEWQPTIKDLPAAERPRERLAAHGATTLATHELLAIVLRSGTPGRPVTQVAQQLLLDFGGLAGLARAPLPELCRQKGVGTAKAAELKAVFEVARRLHLEQPEERLQVRSPADVARLVQLEMAALEHEQFRVLVLDTKNRVLAARKLYDGSVNSAQVRVGEVFREVVRYNGVAVVAVHNHPSGDPTPSADDVALTEALVAGGRVLDVDVLDHIVIGQSGWTSMRERKLGF